MKYTCSMETVQQNGRFTLFLVNSPLIYILFSLLLVHIQFDKVYKKFPNLNALKTLGKKILAAIVKMFYVSSLVQGVPINMGIGRRL